jgi:protein-S-isoprenylcysteine O-methyltransferase Ste14
MPDLTSHQATTASAEPAMQTRLTGIFSPSIRQRIYSIYALIGVLFGAVQVVYSSLQAHQPSWLVAALAVYAFVGGPLGLTAASNVPKSDPR